MTDVTSSLAGGHYGAGQAVDIFLAYSAPVTVIGTPRLRLELGIVDDYAVFTAMKNATNNTLAFLYVIKEGRRTCFACPKGPWS